MTTESKSASLVVRATRIALRPYAKLFFFLGLKLSHFEVACRLAFLDAAVDRMSKDGKPISVKALARLTGLSKRRILELSQKEVPSAELRSLKSSAAYVLNEWATNPGYYDAAGRPIELPLSGGDKSLESLSRIVGCREGLDELLDELRAAGAVDFNDEGRLRLLRRAHIQRDLSDSAIYHFERTLYTIGETLVSNMTSGSSRSRLIERAAFTYGLDPLSLPKFVMLSSNTGANFLENIDEWISANEDKSKKKDGSFISGVGVYAFHAPAASAGFSATSLQ